MTAASGETASSTKLSELIILPFLSTLQRRLTPRPSCKFFVTSHHEYAPNSYRYYNDYNLEQNGKKTDRAVEIVEILQKAGAPIDGVGFQGHLIVGETPSRSELTTVLERFTALDVEVAFTELDIRHSSVPASTAQLKKQGDDYVNVVGACLDVKGCVGVTVWGITDKYSWIPDVFPGTGEALLYTDEYEKKPAWTSVSSLLAAAATGAPISSTAAPIMTTAIPTTMMTMTKPVTTDDCDDLPETDEPVYPTTMKNSSAPTTTMATRTALATEIDDNDDDCETEEAPFPSYVVPTNGTSTLPTKAPVYDGDEDCEDDDSSAPISDDDDECEDDGDFEPTAVAISTAAASAPTRAPVVRTSSAYTYKWNTETRPAYELPSGTAPAGPVGTGNAGLVKHYYQCGGKNYNGPTQCEKPYKCVEQNPYYHQCVEA